MNIEALAHIEHRWSKVKSGPWTLLDYRQEDAGLPVYNRDNVLAYKADKEPLREVRVNNLQQAIQLGLVKNEQEWLVFLEKRLLYDPEEFGCEVLERMRAISCCPPTQFHAQTRRVDRRMFKHDVRGEEPPVHLAIFDSQQGGKPGFTDDDLNFILHASDDVGSLLQEVKRLQQKLEEITGALLDARVREREARRCTEIAENTVLKFGELAAAIVALKDSKDTR